VKVPPDDLRAALVQAGGVEREAKGSGELYRYELDGATVTVWRTGTARVQGKGEGRPVLEKLVADLAHAPPPLPVDLPRDRPWGGVDESGKGDYFGPLVSAAVEVDPSDMLSDLGVADSKRLSDARVTALAPRVRERVRVTVTVLAPPRYNDLYEELRAEGRRLNDLLAWAHARSLEDLLAAGADPAYAIVDQFADARVIEGRLLAGTRERGLRVVQFPRAEADVAVAAASIVARDEFLRRLGGLPKGGASPQVVAAARALVERRGPDALRSVAKLHFATTSRVLGGSTG
jgi:ribonuclease HIII